MAHFATVLLLDGPFAGQVHIGDISLPRVVYYEHLDTLSFAWSLKVNTCAYYHYRVTINGVHFAVGVLEQGTLFNEKDVAFAIHQAGLPPASGQQKLGEALTNPLKANTLPPLGFC